MKETNDQETNAQHAHQVGCLILNPIDVFMQVTAEYSGICLKYALQVVERFYDIRSELPAPRYPAFDLFYLQSIYLAGQW